MITKLKNLRTQLTYLPRTLRLIRQAAGRWTLAWAALLVLQGLLPLATVYLSQGLVDELSLTLGKADIRAALAPMLWWLLGLALVMLTQEALRSAATWVRTVQATRVQDHIAGLIHAQTTTLDLAFYETPDYYDRLHRAHKDAAYRPVALLENLGSLGQSGLTFIAMTGVLLTFGWWVPLVLCVGVLPALGVVINATWRENQWWRRTTVAQRRADYYDWLVTDQSAAAEVRLFGLGDHFRQSYQRIRQTLRTEQTALTRQQAGAEFLASGVALLSSALVMLWLLQQTVQGAVTLGGLTLFYQAFSQGQQIMHTLLGSVTQIYSNLLFLENLFIFLDLRPQLVDPPPPHPTPPRLISGIRFECVTFGYPGSERAALADFSLTIPAGQIVAVVGENGAGKSTLIKLLCRFYDPDGGRVTLDGIDLRCFAQAELHRQITVLFQQPMRYQATAQENIALSDLAANPTLEEIERAAQAAGADRPLEQLPLGYATMLGKWFGGAELSGGEWQRVALARAFLRPAPIIVLDEPTSALDAWAEADWMDRFRALARGRTVLLITHRFTTAMQADVIHVLAQGQIIESGSHTELLARGGRYAASWHQQMQTDRLCSGFSDFYTHAT